MTAAETTAGPEGAEVQLAELFQVLSNSTRIRILVILSRQETSVGELARQLDFSSSAISHQLRVLRAAKLVRSRREGKTVYYRLSSDLIRTMISHGMMYIEKP